MFQTLLCPSSGARDCNVDYHIGRFILGLLYVGVEVRLGWSNVRVAGSSTRVVLEPATLTLLQPNYKSLPTYSKPRKTRLMW